MSTFKSRKNAAKRFGIPSNRLLATSALTAAGLLALSANPATADNWVDLTTTSGSTTTDLSEANTTNIGINSGRAIVEGDLDINAGWTVNVGKGDLVAIDREADPTFIFGRLNCAGSCHVLDVNGVIVGAGGSVDATSVSLSDGELLNRDEFMAGGDLKIGQTINSLGSVGVINEGTITVSDAGMAALLSPFVSNRGTINAKLGTVTLAASETATLDLYGDGLFEVTVAGELADALIENTGVIAAQGGTVEVTALTAKGVVDEVINLDGVVTVASAEMVGGKIVLSATGGGKVSVKGKLDATGKQGGGDIDISADTIILSSTTEIDASSAEGDAGQVDVIGREELYVDGVLRALGNRAGFIETSAPSVVFGNNTVIRADKWLLDPMNIDIDAALAGIVEGQLTAGDWEVLTPAAGGGSGTIRVQEVIDWSSEYTLTLTAIGSVIFETGGGLNATGSGSAVVNSGLDLFMDAGNAGINLAGGNFTANIVRHVAINGGTINANGGNIDINNGGGFASLAADVLKTSGTGTISLNQNKTATTTLPSNTIQNAIDAIDNTGTGMNTINLGAGTWKNPAQVVIDQNLTISGAGVANTELNPDFDTGSSGDSRGWFLVEAGNEFHVDNLTFDGNGRLVHQGIRHKGSGTIDNVAFNDIKFNESGPHYAGIAVAAFGDGAVDITNTTFTNIGRVGALYFGTGVAGSIFADNAYTGKGAGDWLDYALDISAGATVDVLRNTITNNLGVASVDGSTSAGVLVSTFFAPGTSANLESNIINGNSTGVFVGFDGADTSTVTVNGNDLSGNGTGVRSTAQTVDASGNWWGTTDEAAILANISGLIDFTPFLNSGTDTDGATNGFQGDFSALNVTALGEQTGATGRIQEGVNLVEVGGDVNIGAGTFNESTLINKAIRVSGVNRNVTIINPTSMAQNGFTIDGNINGDVSFRRMQVTGAKNGIEAKATAVGLDTLTIGGMKFLNNDLTGVRVNGGSAATTRITTSNFIDNGWGGTPNGGGEGDVLFWLYDGNISLEQVILQNNSPVGGADYGIQIRGSGTAPSGSINLDRVDVKGRYRAAQIGIQEFNGIGPVTMTDVKLGGTTNGGTDSAGWASLYLSNLGAGDLNIGNTEFRGGDLDYIWNITGGDVDATGATFDTADNFDIEDAITHKMDFGLLGLVTWVDNELFVTQNTQSIQSTIDIADAGDTVNVDDSTYIENLNIWKALKLTGHGTTLQAATPANALINVTAAGVEIDPFTFDGLGLMNYGIYAAGVGANGLVVDGNTFKNFNRAGILLAGDAAATGTIKNNTFLGTSTRGMEIGILNNGYILNIENNTIGSATDEVQEGLKFIGQVRDAEVNISGGSINADGGDAIHFAQSLFNGAEVNISDIDVTSSDEAIDFQKSVRSGATVNIFDGEFEGGNNGIEFSAIAGDVNIGKAGESTQISGLGNDKRGVNLLGPITGSLSVDGAFIYGGDDAIGSNDSQNNTVNGGTVTVKNTALGAKNGDGLELGALSNGATVTVEGGIIYAEDNGVHFVNGVDGSTVEIKDTDIFAEGNGVLFGAGSPSVTGGSDITISGVGVFATGIVAKKNGVLFEDVVDGGSTVTIDGAKISTADVSIAATPSGFSASVLASPGTVAGDAVQFNQVNNATIDIKNSTIKGTNGNGVRFGKEINGDAEIKVNNNVEIAGSEDGVSFDGKINNANVQVIGNTKIVGQTDGVAFRGDVENGSVITVNLNDIEGVKGEGIDFDGDIKTSRVGISTNTSIKGGDDAIEMEGISGRSNVEVRNNDSIVAGDHGVAVNGAINGANLFIADNVINANQDSGNFGSGIYFGGTIDNARVTIGDGSRGTDPSNYITVGATSSAQTDGIHFAKDIGDNVNVGIKGNRIGYTGTPGGSNAGQAPASIDGDGIEFAGNISGASTSVRIGDNHILVSGDGVKFGGDVTGTSVVVGGNGDGNLIDAGDEAIQANGINGGRFEISQNNLKAGSNGIEIATITDGAYVKVDNNGINATGNGILVTDAITDAGTTLEIERNTITAGRNGIDIDHVANKAQVLIGDGSFGDNTINAGRNGIEFDAGIDSIVRIVENRISAGWDGINVRDGDPGAVTGVDSGAVVVIADNMIGSEGSDTIGGDGIDFDDAITGNSTVNIYGNKIGRSGAAVGDDGIDIDSITGGATVNITNNPDIRAADNGIEISGVVNGGATLNITGNNHGIHAGDHGIYFGSDINGGANVNIHRNIIGANENQDHVGSGIWFDGEITDANINIGEGGYTTASSSNIIRVASNRTNGLGNSNLDGIHFDDTIGKDAVINIDGNRIGYFANSVGGRLDRRTVAGDGIEFAGEIKSNADINITDNWIRAEDDGVQFSDTLKGRANVLIGGQTDTNFIRGGDAGISFANIKGQSLLEISYNDIAGDNNGIYFGGKISNAIEGSANEQEIFISENTIYGGENGIHFAEKVSGGRHDTRISDNDIEGEDGQGIVFDKKIDGAHIRIVENTRIEGEKDGIRFSGNLENGARVNIDDNALIEGIDEEAIHFDGDIEDSYVSIFSNDSIRAGDNGIEFSGDITNSRVLISENNHGIHADNHGILFGGNVWFGSDIDIHDNIISANEDRGSTGDGIRFDGDIYTADINIGDGRGPDLFDNPSNYITGKDGIHFSGKVTNGADIEIDGNRIGYDKDFRGRVSPESVTDDGIQFLGEISGNADIEITDNRINAQDDGISFLKDVKGNAEIQIGGFRDGNRIYTHRGDGVQFEGDIKEHSLISISRNDIDAAQNGVIFNGDTSNHKHPTRRYPGHPAEIFIGFNDIVGGWNGISFEGEASNSLHDIMIHDNANVTGLRGDGIRHSGGIDDAELWIQNNGKVTGGDDGIQVTGKFKNGAKISITGNGKDGGVRGVRDDGIYVEDTGRSTGADLDIVDNHVHHTGDDGIYVRKVQGALISENVVHNAGDDGIDVERSAFADVLDNQVFLSGDDGIDVEKSYKANINDNLVLGARDDGIEVTGSDKADVKRNIIAFVGDDGIDVERSSGANINRNRIAFALDNGIEVSGGRQVDIKRNKIFVVGNDGINVRNVQGRNPDNWDVVIRGNKVRYAGDDGIEVKNSGNTLIDGVNDVAHVEDDGIRVANPQGYYTRVRPTTTAARAPRSFEFTAPKVHIIDSIVDDAGDDGIEVKARGVNLLADSNTVTNSGDNGILLIAKGGYVPPVDDTRAVKVAFVKPGFAEENTFNSVLKDNIVENSGSNGLRVKNAGHGDVVLEGNTFIDNPVGARFESGRIDLTNTANPNSFIVNPDYKLPKRYDFVTGMQFEQASFDGPTFTRTASTTASTGIPAELTIVGETLGTTEFSGFINRNVDEAFYVRFENGAILDNLGNVIEIDGTQASWDGVVPSAFGNLLPALVLQSIEDRLFDANDPLANGRGNIFVGNVDNGFTIDNVEDFFRQFGAFGPGLSSFDLTVTGLPPVNLGPTDFAGITPFAGEDDGSGVSGIEPAAGGEGSDVADIEPAAGEEVSSCWGDVLNAAVGGAVNYSFSGDADEALAAAASCGS